MQKHPSKIRAVISDWCGTIEANVSSRLAAIKQTCTALNVPIPSDRKIQAIAGMSVHQTLREILGDAVDPDDLERFQSMSTQLSSQVSNQLIMTTASMQWLCKHTIFCLFTNGSRPYVDRNIKKYQLESCFREIATSDDYPAKPAPDMLRDIATKIKCSPSQCLVVGDHPYDRIAAQAAGMPCVIVRTGVAGAEDFSGLAEPLAFCDSINDVPEIIKNINMAQGAS